jgi:hypothetical protein
MGALPPGQPKYVSKRNLYATKSSFLGHKNGALVSLPLVPQTGSASNRTLTAIANPLG